MAEHSSLCPLKSLYEFSDGLSLVPWYRMQHTWWQP